MHFLWSNKITRYFEFIYQRHIGNRNRIFLNLNHILSKTHQLTPHFFRVCALQKSPLYFQEKLMRVSKNGVFPQSSGNHEKVLCYQISASYNMDCGHLLHDLWWSNNCQCADRSIWAAPVKFQNPNKGPENSISKKHTYLKLNYFSRVTHKYTYYKIQKNKLPKKSNKIDSWTWNKIRSTSKSNFFSSIQVLLYVMIPLKSEVTPLPSNKGPINIFIKKKHDR